MLEKIFQQNEKVFVGAYIFFKLPLLISAGFFSYILRFDSYYLFDDYIYPSLAIAFITIFIELTLNNDLFYQNNIDKIFKEISYFIVSVILIILLSVALKITSYYSRYWIILYIANYIILLLIYKFFFNIFYNYLIKSNIFTKNVFVIGNFSEIKKLVKKFLASNKYHIRLIGIKKIENESRLYPIQCIEINNDLGEELKYFEISQIWIINDGSINIEKTLEFFDSTPIDIRMVIPQNLHNEKYITKIFDYSFYETNVSPFNGINYLIKLFFDKIFSALFFIIAIPFIVFFGILILIEDGWPIFFIQKRHGWDGRIINIYKLRSLKKSINNVFKQVSRGDDRVLKTGKIIRRFSIDELPQLINILEGKLSLVGPRPHPIDLNNQHSIAIKGFMQRHKCKPGLTGLAQVNGFRGPTNNPKLMEERFKLDKKYIQNWSLLLDIEIIIKTLFVFLFQKVD